MSAAAVVLSSSPPRIFARSPTSVESSPSLPSPSQLFNFDSNNRPAYQPSAKIREGISTKFKSPRAFLGPRQGAENVPFRSPAGVKFRRSEPKAVSRCPRFIQGTDDGHAIKSLSKGRGEELQDQAGQWTSTGEATSKVVEARSRLEDGPVVMHPEQAMVRRTDWTPPKEISQSRRLEGTNPFPDGLLQSFSFEGRHTRDIRPRQSVVIAAGTTKRQRIQLVAGLAETSSCKPKESGAKISRKLAASKLNKSPAKKAMTITKLATSHYFGQGEMASPMTQDISATQARTVEVEIEERAGEDRIPRHPTHKRMPQSGRNHKPELMSPKSAMKAVEAQGAVFGSASQLAQEEADLTQPRIDPVWTQQTQAISIESTTPRAGRGTSRFVRARNLWGVAARDEDNALLHVDSVDLFDTPDMRAAFTGKDVLLEPNSKIDGSAGPSKATNHDGLDVDDFDSPSLRVQTHWLGPAAKRSFHTSTLARTPSKLSKDDSQRTQRQEDSERDTAPTTSKPASTKPSYAGLTTRDLQKQLSSFGFKPIKKREKMIQLLEQCWEQNQGRISHAEADPVPRHGDFLTKVHDVSSRPQPKMKKSSKRTKADQVEGEVSPQKTTKRQKKTAQPDQGQEIPKEVRSRKSKASTISEPKIIDIDEIESPTVNARGKGTADAEDGIRAATPPSSSPAQALIEKRPITNVGADTVYPMAKLTSDTPTLSGDTPIGEKIQRAIMRQSEHVGAVDRNHQRNPTWHEKILMYDPIVLEDLTVWLNTEGLNLVNEDREVNPLEVRDWCESKGVCCLWRGGWRGQKLNGLED